MKLESAFFYLNGSRRVPNPTPQAKPRSRGTPQLQTPAGTLPDLDLPPQHHNTATPQHHCSGANGAETLRPGAPGSFSSSAAKAAAAKVRVPDWHKARQRLPRRVLLSHGTAHSTVLLNQGTASRSRKNAGPPCLKRV